MPSLFQSHLKVLRVGLYIEKGNNFSLNQRIGMLNFKNNIAKFFYYQLNRHDYYLKFDNGLGQTNLRKDEVLDCPVLVPNKLEQEKIAEFLTAIDERIDHTTAQLTHTKQWKKGLLQQMFV